MVDPSARIARDNLADCKAEPKDQLAVIGDASVPERPLTGRYDIVKGINLGGLGRR